MVAPSPVQRARVIRARREAAIGSALLAAAAGFIALWPYTAVISPGRWSMFTVVVIIVVTGSGLLTRVIAARHPDRALFALGVELVAAIGAVTFLTVPRDAVFGFIPTGVALRSWARRLGDAADQIVYGKAPLEATFALAAVLAIAFALVAILLEQLVTQNLALVAIVLTAIVGSLPMIISGAEANVPWFVLLALLAFFLLRRTARRSSGAPRRASIIMTVGIGAASIVATLVFAPVMPVSTTWAGAGVSAQVNASLRLGDDLRRPDPFTVMTVATRATTAPYLRVATLSSFDGETWEPDDLDRQPLSDGFGDTEWSDDLDAPQQRTSVKVNNLSSSWLPVPYAATKIVGVGSAWEIIPENRTLYSETADAADQDYTVTSRSVQPSKEQIQAATATPVPAGGAAADLPAVIGESARTVTADATNDYDRALALQSWFRSDFSYSLDAPVERGFDGTGTDAVVAFLDEREGYCIHFAGAFALMAQSLDMQVRIVVGYLPGTVTDHKRGAEFLYEVSSDQLHAWSEIHFAGIGWVPFEPTASLGAPTDFRPAASTGGGSALPSAPAPSATPSATATSGPNVDRDTEAESGSGEQRVDALNPMPVALGFLGLIFFALLPLLLRLVIRSARRSRARQGDARSTWDELNATLVDLGVPISSAESPRAVGARLIAFGAEPVAVRVLVGAIERASYAADAAPTGSLDLALTAVIAQLRILSGTGPALRALFLPRSLLQPVTRRSARIET